MCRLTSLLSVVLILGSLSVGCSKKSESKPGQIERGAPVTLPPITITRDRALVFTYRQGGQYRTVSTMDEIPLGARAWVRVQDPAVKAVSPRFVYVADLTKADAKGRFPYKILTRAQFLQGSAGPAGPGMAPAMASGVGSVVIYTRPGCSACASARAYMKQRGIPFVDKDVRADPAAAKELAALAAKKGFQTGVVPVIVVNGEVVIGFDARKLESLLRRRI